MSGDASARFALEDVLSAPFPGELRAAPDGAHAAWVWNAGGCRNLWVAPLKGGAVARALTAYDGDDGLAIGQLCWTPAGDAIVYTRGTCFHDDVPPDPAGIEPGLAAPHLWLAPLDGAAPRLLAAGHAPALSPRGDCLAYVSGGQLWRIGFEDGTPGLLVQDGGRCATPVWSPDGERLAFVSHRREQAQVGVFDIATASLRWLAPGPRHALAPTWSPDGRQLAFIALTDDPAPTYMARPSGAPWSVWIADVGGGAPSCTLSCPLYCAWRADDGPGSVFAPLAAGPQLLWTDCGHLVFPWEGSGRLHLHALVAGAQPGVACDLTPGDGEVFAMAADAGRASVIHVSNAGRADGRRVWRSELAGGRMHALSDAASMTDLPSVAGGAVVALQSDGTTPLHPVALPDGRPLGGSILPARFPVEQLAAPLPVVLTAPDGLRIEAQLFMPPAPAAGARHAAIVHCHGGPARQMLPAWHPLQPYSHQYGLNQYLASQGYLVLSVNYRGGTGYGLAFREPAGFGAGGASEYQDVLAAAHYLRSRGDVDPARIGIYGVSYGGLMTALALARDADVFAAGVDCAGVADWTPAFAGAPTTVLETAAAASPMADLSTWRSPVLLMHADADEVVPFEQTVLLERALRAKGDVHVVQIVLAGEAHDFLRHASWLRFAHATADWFAATMGGGKPHQAARNSERGISIHTENT